MGQEGRILIIDDQHLLRDALRQILQDEGYTVDVASDGANGLAVANADRPDLVLLDLMMPGMNGRQFLTAFRKEVQFVHIPIVLMTAVHGVHFNFALMGAVEILEKPFAQEDLLRTVALAMYRHHDSNLGATQRSTSNGDSIDSGSSAAGSLDDGHDHQQSSDQEGPLSGAFILLIEPHSHQQFAYQEILIGQGCRVLAMAHPTFELARLIRAIAPTAVVMAADIAHAHPLAQPAKCPVVIVDHNVSAADMLLALQQATAVEEVSTHLG